MSQLHELRILINSQVESIPKEFQVQINHTPAFMQRVNAHLVTDEEVYVLDIGVITAYLGAMLHKLAEIGHAETVRNIADIKQNLIGLVNSDNFPPNEIGYWIELTVDLENWLGEVHVKLPPEVKVFVPQHDDSPEVKREKSVVFADQIRKDVMFVVIGLAYIIRQGEKAGTLNKEQTITNVIKYLLSHSSVVDLGPTQMEGVGDIRKIVEFGAQKK